MKKVLSLVLVIAMVLSSMSFAFAGTFTDIADSDYAKAVETLKALGVIDGYDDGTFKPERTLTRAELAKLLVEALGYGKLVAGATSQFSDTQNHWANGYIAIATGTGLVLGMGDGTFAPDAPVTYNQAYTMVLRAIGYTDASLPGTWPTDFIVKAIDLELDEDVVAATTAADRGGVAQILYNALELNLVQVDADNKIENVEGDKILLDKLGDKETYPVDATMVDSESKNYKGDVVDLTPYMYQNVTVYENKDGDVVYVKDVNSLVIEAEVTEDLANNALKVEYNDKDYTFDVTTKTAIFFNGEEADDLTSVDDGLKVTVVLVAEDDEKVATGLDVAGLIARKATVTEMASAVYDDETVVIELEEDYELPLVDVEDEDEGVDFDKLTVTGDVTSLDKIEKDDVVALYYGKNVADAANKLEIVVTRDVVEGKITRVNSDGDVTVAGKVYADGGYGSYTLFTSAQVGETVTMYLDQDGDIYYAEATSAVLADYAIVLETKQGFETVGGVRLAEPKVKLLTAEGETITYVVDDESEDLPAGLVTTSGAIDITVNLAEGALVKYDLNKDGELNDVEVVGLGTYYSAIKTTGNSFNLADNAVIFNLPDAVLGDVDATDADVVANTNLNDTVAGYKVFNEAGTKIEVLVVYGNVTEDADSVYAVVTDNTNFVLDSKDDTVIEYTVLVNGVEETYLGKADVSTPVVDVDGALVELVFDGDRLVDFNTIAGDGDQYTISESGKAQDSRVTTSVKFVDAEDVVTATHFLSDDVVVYVFEADDDVVVGSKSDIRGKNVTLYNLTADDTDDFSVVVVDLH